MHPGAEGVLHCDEIMLANDQAQPIHMDLTVVYEYVRPHRKSPKASKFPRTSLRKHLISSLELVRGALFAQCFCLSADMSSQAAGRERALWSSSLGMAS
jgi:hypothetical protein